VASANRLLRDMGADEGLAIVWQRRRLDPGELIDQLPRETTRRGLLASLLDDGNGNAAGCSPPSLFPAVTIDAGRCHDHRVCASICPTAQSHAASPDHMQPLRRSVHRGR
jgi:hypothetical protein